MRYLEASGAIGRDAGSGLQLSGALRENVPMQRWRDVVIVQDWSVSEWIRAALD